MAINAFSIWMEKKKLEDPQYKLERKKYLWLLYEHLVGPHVDRRKKIGYSGVQKHVQDAIDKVFFSIYPAEEQMSLSNLISETSS